MMEVQSKSFDRISFKWNGRAGAKLMVRFNCLSTDFSRVKGVKGIPLRVHMNSMASNDEQTLERAFAKIKLFRDKVSISFIQLEKEDCSNLERMSVFTLVHTCVLPPLPSFPPPNLSFLF